MTIREPALMSHRKLYFSEIDKTRSCKGDGSHVLPSWNKRFGDVAARTTTSLRVTSDKHWGSGVAMSEREDDEDEETRRRRSHRLYKLAPHRQSALAVRGARPGPAVTSRVGNYVFHLIFLQ